MHEQVPACTSVARPSIRLAISVTTDSYMLRHHRLLRTLPDTGTRHTHTCCSARRAHTHAHARRHATNTLRYHTPQAKTYTHAREPIGQLVLLELGNEVVLYRINQRSGGVERGPHGGRVAQRGDVEAVRDGHGDRQGDESDTARHDSGCGGGRVALMTCFVMSHKNRFFKLDHAEPSP